MPVGDLTSRTAVEAAIAEFDRLGCEAFLEKYGFHHARRRWPRLDPLHGLRRQVGCPRPADPGRTYSLAMRWEAAERDASLEVDAADFANQKLVPPF